MRSPARGQQDAFGDCRIGLVKWFESERGLGFWGTVAATLVASAAAFFSDAARRWIGLAWSWSMTPIAVPGLVLCVLLAIVLGLGGLLLVAYWQGQAQPSWASYVEDSFLGVVWRWAYTGHLRHQLTAYCPKCELRLDLARAYYHGVGSELRCQGCGFVQALEFQPGEVVEQVVKLIERELRRRERSDGSRIEARP